MYSPGSIQWYHFQENLIWPDGTFKKLTGGFFGVFLYTKKLTLHRSEQSE
jgi:hypothetical protein